MMPIVVQTLKDLVSKSPFQDPLVAIWGAASRTDSAEGHSGVAGHMNQGGPGPGDIVPTFRVPWPAPQSQGCLQVAIHSNVTASGAASVQIDQTTPFCLAWFSWFR